MPTEHFPKIVSEYDQEIPQSQTADNTMAPSLVVIVNSQKVFVYDADAESLYDLAIFSFICQSASHCPKLVRSSCKINYSPEVNVYS